MGFLNKAFKKAKKQIQPGNMIARDMGPGNMPKRPDIFGRDSFLFGRRPRGGMGMPSNRELLKGPGGYQRPQLRPQQLRSGPALLSGPALPLASTIQGNVLQGSPGGTPGFYDREMAKVNPIRPGMDDGRVYAGGSPGLYAPGGRFNRGGRDRIMPDLSQIDMSQLDLSGIPQSISQMNLPQMSEGLPSMEEIQGNRRMPQMDRGRMQPRQMMAEGDEVFMPSNPNQIAFSIETEIKNLMNEYEMAANNGEIERAQKVVEQINELEARRIQAMNEAKAMENTQGMMYGGEMKGYANGGEIEAMLGGMDSGEQEAMGELEQMAPEMEMIDQLVMMVAQMIQQGAGEEQVISFLREQGLDDEDIGTVLQLVAEMAETEEVAAQNKIGSDLEQLG
tara:strand:- start:629 stop:1804 length:1176 start_codon:yes stop_codon:yes gene_type:complete